MKKDKEKERKIKREKESKDSNWRKKAGRSGKTRKADRRSQDPKCYGCDENFQENGFETTLE